MEAQAVVTVGFSAGDWLQLMGLGAASGAVGQVIRMVVGLKKLSESIEKNPLNTENIMQVSRLVISIIIGAAAGMIAAVLTKDNVNPQDIHTEYLMALLAAGYAGTDFIEGTVSRLVPKPKSAAPPSGNTLAAE